MIPQLARLLAPAAPPVRIGIVGCGISGAAAAIAIARRMSGPTELVIADASGHFGPGFAHGPAAGRGELLNVRARDLSMVPDAPGDFTNWLAGQAAGRDDAAPESFQPRATFGRYAGERLREALSGSRNVATTLLTDEAVAAEPAGDRLRVRFRHHGCQEFDALFVATGYGTREPSLRRLGQDPYRPLDAEMAKAARNALFVGGGLTMVDSLVNLRRAGFAGAATVVSRHGLLPRPHTPRHADVKMVDLRELKSLSAILRHVRRTEREIATAGGDWQGVANAVRCQVQDVWTSFTLADRQRFLDHLAPYWENIRHRLPPELHAELDALPPEVLEGRVLEVRRRGTCQEAIVEDVRGRLAARRFDLVFDCTGYRPAVDTPFVQSLVAQGLVMPDPLRMGLAVARSGRVRSAGGRSGPPVFALGPLGRGSLYEITAVPQIVAQAAAAAEALSRLSARGRARHAASAAPWGLRSFA
ncbi:FAD/NAD(P)-binding protein [Lutibaculum baratangense]|uniref:FAD-dependent urate hydroxylase HpyO/Asp monooxygenase CreE-like FAD/NAD(P)-binding domain-containing protein n=1 Tax=Lutibaculum baratangense AMV1 TaxID=631454 RepID=V4TH00_9HYPH|nr:FAD/NAD(P)-binding protein [Lutibaculum baratangense]ESR25363.1 hypothetical protein N177_1880 [Lutibaculum baratangense AMV1]